MGDGETIAPDRARHLGSTPLSVPLKVVVVAGPDEGAEAHLNLTLTIGTDAGNDFVLTDPAVSRRHCVLTRVGGRVVVEDKESRNGTILGGARIGHADLPLGGVLTLGDSALALYPRWHTREVAPSHARRFGELIGDSVAMREVFAVLERAAPTDASVLLEGESGTGKEVAARSIHAASARATRDYVVFDCGAIPRELAESELFGHKVGAFSGAVADREGAFRRAHGGTIFLDEIGELPIDLQPKLLRVLETGELRSVGEDVMRKVDVRAIAATNRDLHAEARRGAFRQDLLYRLEVVKVRIPPLRSRPEDIAALAAHFLAGKLAAGDAVAGDNLRALQSYAWPGNARELRNVLMRAVALAGPPSAGPPRFDALVFNLGPASASPATLGVSYPGVATPVPYKEAKAELLASFERAYVDALLTRHPDSISQAAEAAGLSRKHLYALIARATGDAPPDD